MFWTAQGPTVCGSTLESITCVFGTHVMDTRVELECDSLLEKLKGHCDNVQ